MQAESAEKVHDLQNLENCNDPHLLKLTSTGSRNVEVQLFHVMDGLWLYSVTCVYGHNSFEGKHNDDDHYKGHPNENRQYGHYNQGLFRKHIGCKIQQINFGFSLYQNIAKN